MRYTVGVGDMKVSGDSEDLLITHALGSCLGITVHDPVACVGGLLHVMLPQSSIDPQKAQANPCMFVDSGVPKLFLDAYKLGARKERMIVKVAGGATSRATDEEDYFQIGKRNIVMLRKVLWKNGVLLDSCEVGGNESRTMLLDIGTGTVSLKIHGVTSIL